MRRALEIASMTRRTFSSSSIRSSLVCSRPAVSMITTSMPRRRLRERVEGPRPGSAPGSPVTISQPGRRPRPRAARSRRRGRCRRRRAGRSAQLLAQLPGELADRRRLAGAVDADGHDHGRLRRHVDPPAPPSPAVSASRPYGARRAARRPRGRPPAASSSVSTTVAVITAPTSAMISASSRRSHVSRRASRTGSPESPSRAPGGSWSSSPRRRNRPPLALGAPVGARPPCSPVLNSSTPFARHGGAMMSSPRRGRPGAVLGDRRDLSARGSRPAGAVGGLRDASPPMGTPEQQVRGLHGGFWWVMTMNWARPA